MHQDVTLSTNYKHANYFRLGYEPFAKRLKGLARRRLNANSYQGLSRSADIPKIQHSMVTIDNPFSPQ
jgi:hypothetical protein